MQQAMGVTRVPRTFGILSIVFASLVLLSSLFGLCGLIVPIALSHAPPPTSADQAQAMAFVSRMYTAMGTLSALLSVMSGALLALGIGQLRYRRWASVWSVRWAIVALGVVAVMAILMATTFTGSFVDILANGPTAAATDKAAAHAVGKVFGGVYAAMTVMFYAPYPILLLIFFSRRHVRAAMNA